MELFLGALISGITLGLVYGLLGFSVVVLYKSTGVVSFAQHTIAMFTAFVGYFILRVLHLPAAVGVLVALVAAGIVGVLLYWTVMRPNDRIGGFNLILRTLGMYTLLFAIANTFWSEGQPFRYPSIFPRGSFRIGGIFVPRLSLVYVAVVVALLTIFVIGFSRSKTGLLLRAVADSPGTVRLLGVNARRLTAVSWGLATVVAFIVALLIVPTTFLSTTMADEFLLFTFAGALLGGLTHWYGPFIGGVIVGVVGNVALVYSNPEVATVLIFILLLGGLTVRPQGILGSTAVRRL